MTIVKKFERIRNEIRPNQFAMLYFSHLSLFFFHWNFNVIFLGISHSVAIFSSKNRIRPDRVSMVILCLPFQSFSISFAHFIYSFSSIFYRRLFIWWTLTVHLMKIKTELMEIDCIETQIVREWKVLSREKSGEKMRSVLLFLAYFQYAQHCIAKSCTP